MSSVDQFLHKTPQDEKFYNEFVKKIIEMTKDWKDEYSNSNVMDGKMAYKNKRKSNNKKRFIDKRYNITYKN